MAAPMRDPSSYDELNITGEAAASTTTNEPNDEVVQVVYQSDQNGTFVGVESSLLDQSQTTANFSEQESSLRQAEGVEPTTNEQHSLALENDTAGGHQHLSRATSTLPSVAEESTTSSGGGGACQIQQLQNQLDYVQDNQIDRTTDGQINHAFLDDSNQTNDQTSDSRQQTYPIYATINRNQHQRTIFEQPDQPNYVDQSLIAGTEATSFYSNRYQQESIEQEFRPEIAGECGGATVEYKDANDEFRQNDEADESLIDEATKINQEISELISRQKGFVEKGSFRNNFRKKLGISMSTNEKDLTTYRQRFLESSLNNNNQELNAENHQNSSAAVVAEKPKGVDDGENDDSGRKFKRTHSVSFNIHASRSNRLSVDIRNLPSYLTHKRASIVDVAKGAMSSLISSFGGGSGAGSLMSDRRDSNATMAQHEEDEPIFEEPIAPTLSLGQRVALVRSGGSEFGTVGWIGQLAEVDDDWVVGVIFDNMIGNCDGSFNGVRYFYARENFAMFVPLSTLTKTDNYIGRPETGTMLSRMSITLRPGQLISIQRSSIRLQHCFLNAPHQRVGHDVRAVSNRLHCQCHNCGPCAHLTKQGRVAAMPHFGSHHIPHRKKNSLAHAAVELLAHHHHHFHEDEEEHEEKDYEFGDNAAHACNFVRYSCCQQNGVNGHDFSSDCQMVRPELLDNLIHAPKAPHRRSRPRRRARTSRNGLGGKKLQRFSKQALAEGGTPEPTVTESQQVAETFESNVGTMSSMAKRSEPTETSGYTRSRRSSGSPSGSSSSSSHSDRSSQLSRNGFSSRSNSPENNAQTDEQIQPYNYYTYDSTTTTGPASGGFGTAGAVYNTIDSHISIMDQRRYIDQRDSSAVIQTSHQNSRILSREYHTGSDSSDQRNPGLTKRILMCLGCLKRVQRHTGGRVRRNGHRRGSNRSSTSTTSKHKLSAKDRVIDYRRRQSQFVPSTLAKPQQDFASHGIILGKSIGVNQQMDPNSDYSSYSKSSSCASSPCSHEPPRTDLQSFVADVHVASNNANEVAGPQTLSHVQSESNSNIDYGLKCNLNNCDESHIGIREPTINYGDYNFGEGYDTYNKDGSSRDSALADLAYSYDTFKADSSCDTLKQLVDQSINEQVLRPSPVLEHLDSFVSPISNPDSNDWAGHESNQNIFVEQVDISSPTASTASAMGDEREGDICRAMDSITLEDSRNQKDRDFSDF